MYFDMISLEADTNQERQLLAQVRYMKDSRKTKIGTKEHFFLCLLKIRICPMANCIKNVVEVEGLLRILRRHQKNCTFAVQNEAD